MSDNAVEALSGLLDDARKIAASLGFPAEWWKESQEGGLFVEWGGMTVLIKTKQRVPGEFMTFLRVSISDLVTARALKPGKVRRRDLLSCLTTIATNANKVANLANSLRGEDDE